MATGDSDVTICRNAVRRLGGKTFAAFTDDVKGAGLCGDIYQPIKLGILSGYDWHFLTEKRQLNREVTGPIAHWDFQYQLQPDRVHDAPIKVWNTNQVGARNITSGWEIQGNKLLSDETEIWVDYGVEKDEGLWPAYFVELLTQIMMLEMAYFMTDQENVAQRLEVKINGQQGTLAKAKQRNAQDNPNRVVDNDLLIRARFGGVGGGRSPNFKF